LYRIVEFVNPNEQNILSSVEFLDEIYADGRMLNLADILEEKWILWSEIFPLNQIDEIVLAVGPQAGFTDSRMIFVWLKTWQQSNSKAKSLRIVKADDESFKLFQQINLSNQKADLKSNLQKFINKMRENSLENLQYTRNPNIGKK